jgi:DMSO/TMAO reductase YedYZ molybdopterin-dependent catalytic subunit
VLTAEATPTVDAERWTLRIDGLVEEPVTWTLAQLRALPTTTWRGDIHCVTTWSKLDTSFVGVDVDTLLGAARPLPQATHAMVTSTTRYRTNHRLADLTDGQAWVVWDHEGRPLPREHGGPVRMIVPHLYFWKSAKWVASITLLDHDEPGFWEVNGYHLRGDPWLEQRFHGD